MPTATASIVPLIVHRNGWLFKPFNMFNGYTGGKGGYLLGIMFIIYSCLEIKWDNTRTKIPDGAVTHVGPFPRSMTMKFRTLASTLFLNKYFFLIRALFISINKL